MTIVQSVAQHKERALIVIVTAAQAVVDAVRFVRMVVRVLK